jgi:hypothetical protein
MPVMRLRWMMNKQTPSRDIDDNRLFQDAGFTNE